MDNKKWYRYVWCLPQLILGAIVLLFSGATYDPEEKVFRWKGNTNGLSLDLFIFVPKGCNQNYLNHERGHTKQSEMLGPLYLLVIGLPSIIWNVVHTKLNKNYYTFYTESWADKLGGVHRDY